MEKYVNGKCQCGLDGSSGYCQYPGPTEISAYYTAISPLWKTDLSKCHTLDFMNFRALAECANSTIDNTTLLAYAGTQFNFTNWAFIQGNTP